MTISITTPAPPSFGMTAEWIQDDTNKSKEFLETVVHTVVGSTEQTESRLPKVLTTLVVDYLESFKRFGQKEWSILGTVPPEPLLPPNFKKAWDGACPLTPGKRLCDTHTLVYLPYTLNNEALTFQLFTQKIEEITITRISSIRFDFSNIGESAIDKINPMRIDKGRWILITRETFTRSSIPSLKEGVGNLKGKSENSSYKIPSIIEGIIGCVATLAIFPWEQSDNLFCPHPTICQEVISNCNLQLQPVVARGELLIDGIPRGFGYHFSVTPVIELKDTQDFEIPSITSPMKS